jgi:GTP-binding protein
MSQEQILDSGDLEREKGITIKAKNASIRYKDYKINIIDTPGHADFGGEVERTLNMAEGCLLLVDAQEGPMPQTKFVLRKALEIGLRPIVVINKIDKQFANPEKVLDKVHDLFLELATDESQLDFPVFYAIAREGKVFDKMPTPEEIAAGGTVSPILERIIAEVPIHKGGIDEPFRLQISNIDYDDHMGRALLGKVDRGRIQKGKNLVVVNEDGEKLASGRVKAINIREGLSFVEVDTANPGEIITITGIDSTAIGATVCDSEKIDPLPSIKISPPALKIKFEANTSPFLGREGEFVTSKQIQQRLEKEGENNISLEITKGDGGSYYVAGRGELQLSILIETMRREGYEFQIRKPEIFLKEENGKKMQPKEELLIDAPEEYQSGITKLLMERKADITNIENDSGNARITSTILTANLFGLRNQLVTLTKNQAVMNSYVVDYVPFTKEEDFHRNGVLISMATGTSMGYSLNTIQERGELFVGPSEEVYEGMLIGTNKYEEDMEVNPTKARQKSAVRMKHDEITQTSLKSIKKLTLEFALVFLAKDEILEITPKNLRLRKEYLTKIDRDRARRAGK